MKTLSITTYITETDSDDNRYSVSCVESLITGKQVWIDHGWGDGISNACAHVFRALGYESVSRNTVPDVSKPRYRAMRDGALLDHQDKEIAEALQALEAGGLKTRNHAKNDNKVLEDAMESLFRLHDCFDGPLAAVASVLRIKITEEIERHGRYVVSANGGNRMKLYSVNGAVGKAVLARREALRKGAEALGKAVLARREELKKGAES